MSQLTLVSHHLCPYVQRAVITLTEKNTAFERHYIDLGNKPDWFVKLSPLGKVPLLQIGDRDVLFESAVICEYLEETQDGVKLHPLDPLQKAQHRAWIEFASASLNDIWGYYVAADEAAYKRKEADLAAKFQRLEDALGDGPYFSGNKFSLVDAAFGPVFRYFDVFESFTTHGIFESKPKVAAWRAALAKRPSVKGAVTEDYPERLLTFLKNRNSYISTLIH